MAYNKQMWVNGETLVDAQHLNYMENGIESANNIPDLSPAYVFKREAQGNLNVLRPYEADEWGKNYTIYSSGIPTYTGDDASYSVTPLIPVEAGHTYALLTPFGTQARRGGLHSGENNAIGYYAADGETVVSRAGHLIQWIDAVIALFTAPAGASYVRFTIYHGTESGGNDNLFNMTVNDFNRPAMFYLIKDATEDVQKSDFTYTPPVHELRGVTVGAGMVNVSSLDPLSQRILTPLYGKKILCLGDSIFGNDRTDGLCDYLAGYSGATVYNGAVGGTRACPRAEESGYKYYDGQNLVHSIVSGDLSNLRNWRSYVASYVKDETYPMFESLDLSTIDIVTMNWGSNDLTSNTRKEDYVAAMMDIISTIRATYPRILIVLCTMAWHMDGGINSDVKTYTIGNGYDIADACIEVAHAAHVPVFDAYRNLPLSEETKSFYLDSDEVHPNKNGNQSYAKMLCGFLKALS